MYKQIELHNDDLFESITQVKNILEKRLRHDFENQFNYLSSKTYSDMYKDKFNKDESVKNQINYILSIIKRMLKEKTELNIEVSYLASEIQLKDYDNLAVYWRVNLKIKSSDIDDLFNYVKSKKLLKNDKIKNWSYLIKAIIFFNNRRERKI